VLMLNAFNAGRKASAQHGKAAQFSSVKPCVSTKCNFGDLMRHRRGGITHMAAVIEDDLTGRDTGLHKRHLKGLADLASTPLSCSLPSLYQWQYESSVGL
jgi:hypothetical protein